MAVSSANQASGIIRQTGAAVMALGGFSGSDPILTADDLAQLVANGTIRYVLVGGQGGGQSSPTSRITGHGTSQLYDLLGAGQ